jgi:hypothetical protein
MKQQTTNSQLLLKGIIYANIFAIVSFAIAHYITNWNSDVGYIFTFSEFVLVPISMGIISMKYWIHTGNRLIALLPYAVVNTIIAIGLSALFMGEGVICLIIVSPLILTFLWCGVFLGKYIFRYNTSSLKATTFTLLLAIFVFDNLSVHNYTNMVTDEIIINAPKELVWKYIAAHPENRTEPDYWLFRIGLPSPIQSTITMDTLGAERKCIFSNGATFDEVVVERMPGRIFTFDVTKQPADPEIIGHINILRGQFILKSNADGTTTLIGNSWYKLNVYPVWYYDLWAIDITRNVHLRVMQHIKTLAEKDV